MSGSKCRFLANRFGICIVASFLCPVILSTGATWVVAANPQLNSLFPPGGSVGTTVEVAVAGDGLDGLKTLHSNAPGFSSDQDESNPNRFRVSISPDTPLGLYDLRVVCSNGLSSPRPFVIGNRPEQFETEPNEPWQSAPTVPLNVVINGRIEKAGDFDFHRFEAQQGERIVIECSAERIDSQLRAVLEILDHQGQRLASNRGYFGIDPLIDFRVPADGAYIVKVYDLIHAGSPEHYYRLEIDTGPRVAFAFPAVVQQGKPARVQLYGWNLDSYEPVVANLATGPRENGRSSMTEPPFDRIEVEIPETMTRHTWPLPFGLQPAQTGILAFPYYLAGSHAPVPISVTDVSVVTDKTDNHSPEVAQEIVFPCEVSGQLVAGDEQDWFAIDAKHGEVLYLEGYSQRIGSTADLDVRVLDSVADEELLRLGDEVRNIGGKRFPTNHLDPAGRWLVPADGRYLILVRNMIGGLRADSRRTYRLSIRREEPDFNLAVIPQRNDPAGVNVNRGGRTVLDVIALRSRGLTGGICVSAKDLPAGVECPDVWLGPGVNRAPLVISASHDAPDYFGELILVGTAEMVGPRNVRGGVVVRAGLPNGWGRLTSEIPLAIAGTAHLQIRANAHETRHHQLYGELNVRHSPGGILDVAVHVLRSDATHQAAVKLLGDGLPELIENQTATISPGSDKGYISFYLPPSLPVGRYSLAIRGETTIPVAEDKVETVTVSSNVVTFDVHQPAFRIEVDRLAPKRIQRGEVIQVNYTAQRINGFISKIHTELAAPGQVTDVLGLRGRGVTFTGQTETGTIQIIANDDAPLGQLPFLRLYGVGVLEDEALFHGGCFLNLEVIE